MSQSIFESHDQIPIYFNAAVSGSLQALVSGQLKKKPKTKQHNPH